MAIGGGSETWRGARGERRGGVGGVERERGGVDLMGEGARGEDEGHAAGRAHRAARHL